MDLVWLKVLRNSCTPATPVLVSIMSRRIYKTKSEWYQNKPNLWCFSLIKVSEDLKVLRYSNKDLYLLNKYSQTIINYPVMKSRGKVPTLSLVFDWLESVGCVSPAGATASQSTVCLSVTAHKAFCQRGFCIHNFIRDTAAVFYCCHEIGA